MGRTFFEGHIPELIRQLTRIGDGLEKILQATNEVKEILNPEGEGHEHASDADDKDGDGQSD